MYAICLTHFYMQLGVLFVIFEDILKCTKLAQVYVSKLHTYHGLCTETA